MKRSRIFLGITTSLLAIAGVVAAKTHRNPISSVFYYTGPNGLVNCKLYSPNALCLKALTDKTCFYVTTNLAQLTLYTNAICTQIAYYDPE